MASINLPKPLFSSPIRQLIYDENQELVHQAINKVCADHFLVFMKLEVGLEVGPHHYEWWEDLKTREDTIYLSPRDHGKSHCLCRAYPIWRAKYDKWVREIYLLGADQSSAVENLDKIKSMMLKHRSLASLIPETRTQGINSRTELYLRNGVIIKAKGFFSPLRGRHPQLIILDDVLNEKNSATSDTRKRVKDYFWEAVMPMKDQGTQGVRDRGFKSQVVVIGTAQDQDDLYHELLLPEKGFRGKKQKAVIDEVKKTVLWPSRYPYEALMKIKVKQGSLSFSKEYQNEPLSDDTSLFPPSLFEPLFDRDLEYPLTYDGDDPSFLGADFSIPGSMDGDWTVVFVFRKDKKTGEIIPLHYWRSQPTSMQEQLLQIEDICNRYNVTLGYLEDNMFQRVYSEHFRANSSLPLKGHTVTHTGKMSLETGILSFRPIFENGQVRFPYKTDRDKLMTDHILLEFNGITKKKGKIGNQTTHDDTVLAFWHALRASKNTISFSYDMG